MRLGLGLRLDLGLGLGLWLRGRCARFGRQRLHRLPCFGRRFGHNRRGFGSNRRRFGDHGLRGVYDIAQLLLLLRRCR